MDTRRGGDVVRQIGMKNLLVTISKTAELLLPGGVPDVHKDGAEVGEELERVDLDAHSSQITLLKLARDMALDEGSLSDTTVANEDDLEGRDILGRSSHRCLAGRDSESFGAEECGCVRDCLLVRVGGLERVMCKG